MEAVRRVVIHDQHPVLGPELVARPLNVLVLIAAATTLAIQALALVQVLTGAGTATGVAGDKAGATDHVAFAIVALLWVCLGIVVFLQRRARFAGQFFLLAACAGAAFLSLGTLYSASLADALTFAVALLLLPAFLLEFTRFADENRAWRSPELLLFIPPAILAWPVAHHLQNTHTDVALWQIALIIVAAYLIAAVIQTWRDALRATKPDRAAQSRVRILGLGVGTAATIPLFIVPLVVGGHLETVLTWLPLIALIFLIAMAWAALIFEFDHAELLVRRSIVFSLLAVAVTCVYGAVGFVLVNAGARLIGLGGLVELAIAALVVGAGFVPLQRASRRAAGWLIYGARSDRWRLLQDLSRHLDRVMSPDSLAETLVTELTDALHLRGAAFFQYAPEGSFRLVAAVGDAGVVPGTIDITAADALGHPPAPLLLTHAKPLASGRSQTVAPELRVLDELHSMLTVPLVIRARVEALLCLQPKLAHDTFDSGDLALLAPILGQASAALDNALLVQQLTDNVTELQAAYLRITHEQEAERSRLARELHDGITQELAAVITLVAVLERQLGRRDPDASVTLDHLRRQAQIAYEGVRDASHGLLPPILANQGLVPALHALLDAFEASEGINVERQFARRRLSLRSRPARSLSYRSGKPGERPQAQRLGNRCHLPRRLADARDAHHRRSRRRFPGRPILRTRHHSHGAATSSGRRSSPRRERTRQRRKDYRGRAGGDPDMAAPVRVILIEDHAVVRDGLNVLVGLEPDIEVVGLAGTGLDGVALAERAKPGVAVTDVGLPDIDGAEVTRRIRSRVPETRVLALTAHEEERYILALLDAGASGYLLKSVAGEELVTAIRTLAAGNPWIQAVVAHRLIAASMPNTQPNEGAPERLAEPLTARESQVLTLLAGAASNHEIAAALGIGVRTVETHLSNIYGKIEVGSRTQAMLWAVREGFAPS